MPRPPGGGIAPASRRTCLGLAEDAPISGAMKALSLAALLLVGCMTTETRQVSSVAPAIVRVGERARMWQVLHGDEAVGTVVAFQEAGLACDAVYFVRNPWGQDLGMIDGLGRAFRYLPHHKDPAWVGSGTVLLGAERILDLGPCRLVEMEAEKGAAEASPAPASSDSSLPAPVGSGQSFPVEGLAQSR